MGWLLTLANEFLHVRRVDRLVAMTVRVVVYLWLFLCVGVMHLGLVYFVFDFLEGFQLWLLLLLRLRLYLTFL